MSVRPAKTQISLGIRLCALCVAKDHSFLQADSEDSDQTGRMPRLIRVFAGRTTIMISPYEPPRDKINKLTCAPSEVSDQPGHPPSLIRVFAVRSLGS